MSGGDLPFSLKGSRYVDPKWVKRCFSIEMARSKKCLVLYKLMLLDKIVELPQEKDGCCTLDVVRLTHNYLMAVVITLNKNASMALHYIAYLKKNSKICEYNWSAFIVSLLKNKCNRLEHYDWGLHHFTTFLVV